MPMSKAPVRKKLPDSVAKSTINLRDPIWFREWFKVIARQWAMHLTARQYVVVMFIFDRTAAWGKEWEMIKSKSFVEGVTSSDGSVRYAAGPCGSIRPAIDITNELLDMGMIRRRRSRDGNYWSINYEWKPDNMKEPRKLTRMRVKDSLEGAEISTIEVRKSALSDVLKSACHKKNKVLKENVSQKINLSDPDGPEGGSTFNFEELLERGLEKGKASIEKRKLRQHGKLSSVLISQMWRDLHANVPWRDHITPRLYISKRDAQALKSYSDRFAKALPNESFREFMAWCITSWPGISSELFSWMTTSPPPETPAALFLIKWAERFEGLFLQRLAFDKRMKLTPDERAVGKLVRSGMSQEDAEAKVLGIKARPSAKPSNNNTKTHSFTIRKARREPIALPSSDDSDFNPYED